MSSNTIYSKNAITSTLYFLKPIFRNLNSNFFGYLIFTATLYLFTPFPLQLNDWPTIRQRLITILELPVSALDTAVAAIGK